MNDHARGIVNLLKQNEGFNNFEPRLLAAALIQNVRYIKDAFWRPDKDDTIYIVPNRGELAAVKLALMGHEINADEIDFMAPKDVLFEAVDNYGYEFSKVVMPEKDEAYLRKMLKGQKRILRLWWD